MKIAEKIISQLTSSYFSDFSDGIETADNNFKEIAQNREIFERVISVFIYHKVYEHKELIEASSKIEQDFPQFANELLSDERVAEDWFLQGQIEGLSVFLFRFSQGELDVSKYFLTFGFVYQIVAQSCENILELADKSKWNEVCDALETFKEIFDNLWKLQMTAQDFISKTEQWNEEIINSFNHIFYQADVESQDRMLRGLSEHSDNKEVREKIVNNYLNSLNNAIETAEDEDLKSELVALKEEVNELFF